MRAVAQHSEKSHKPACLATENELTFAGHPQPTSLPVLLVGQPWAVCCWDLDDCLRSCFPAACACGTPAKQQELQSSVAQMLQHCTVQSHSLVPTPVTQITATHRQHLNPRHVCCTHGLLLCFLRLLSLTLIVLGHHSLGVLLCVVTIVCERDCE